MPLLALRIAIDNVAHSLLHQVIGIMSTPSEAFLPAHFLNLKVMDTVRLLIIQPCIGRNKRRMARLIARQ